MEWLDRLNLALDYMESNLDGEIDYGEAARLTCCSLYHFQRMFSYIAGVPLSEYIRRRRMTRAAFDLQRGDRVLDVALRYGYESPTSFNRAFQTVHGVTPSSAQKEGAALTAFPRISFQIMIKGDTQMEYRIEKKDAFRIIGIKATMASSLEQNFQEVPLLWERAGREHVIERLLPLMNLEPKGILGVGAGTGSAEGWEYYIAVASDREAPEGMYDHTIPACTWAIFPGKGPMPGAIQELEKRVVTEWLPTSGYEYADAADLEVYLTPDPANATFEVWVPVRKKEGTDR